MSIKLLKLFVNLIRDIYSSLIAFISSKNQFGAQFELMTIYKYDIYIYICVYLHIYIAYMYWVIRKVRADFEGKLKRRKFKF